MSQDLDSLLKDSGYLNSPADRFLWRNATPTLRSHLRQFSLLALTAALPFALLLASLSRLQGLDRMWLLWCYLFGAIALLAIMDVLAGFLVRSHKLASLWRQGAVLNFAPIAIAGLLLFTWAAFLAPAIAYRPITERLPAWLWLTLNCWLAAKATTLLFVSRLYWHGIQPPDQKAHPLVMVVLLGAILAFQLLPTAPPKADITPTEGSPILWLAIDVAPEDFDLYQPLIPGQTIAEGEADMDDITDFWAELGSGIEADLMQVSLVSFDTPLFKQGLTTKDPTQRPPLAAFRLLGLAQPKTADSGGRFRKYLWEILDDYGVRTFSYGYWHTYPAATRHGGVMSERWGTDREEPPYAAGVARLQPQLDIPEPPDETLSAISERESQIWAQLHERAGRNDFQFIIAYLPLADLYRDLSSKPEAKTELEAYRRRQMQQLLGNLTEDTRLGLILSSGKPRPQGVRWRVVANWLEEMNTNDHRHWTPWMLHAFGLPLDRLMTPPAQKFLLDRVSQRVDYGEPEQNRSYEPVSDQDYYEELRSLGYVQ